jgi:FkbM family methyltransferase
MPLDSTDFITCRGVRIPADPEVITGKIARKLRTESYETQEVTGLSEFVRSSDRILELGAGIGFISSFLAKTLNVKHITCVEANPALCEFAARVHKANDVDCADIKNLVACSDDQMSGTSDTVPFFVTDPFWSSSLKRPSAGDFTEIKVARTPLSEIVAETKSTVIVCDIEGGESDLFEDTNLQGVRSVFMELHTRVYGGRGIMKVFESMHKNGFFYHQRASRMGAVLFKRL